MKKIVIATRESALAMWQAERIKEKLLAHYPELTVSFLGLTTTGDQILDVPLSKIGGKGLFLKELEQALLAGKADIAVHSMKDVPQIMPEDFSIAAICDRVEVRDAWVGEVAIADLPPGAIVGTSSLRRQSQVLAAFPHLTVRSIRGNVQTRLKKLAAGEYDGLVMAAAGLQRLGLAQRIHSFFSLEDMLPAPGQGALGIECLADNKAMKELIAVLDEPPASTCVKAERALCKALGGGCEVPLAAYAALDANQLHVRGLVASPCGTECLVAEVRGDSSDAEVLGVTVANQLLAQGAQRILNV